MDICDMWLLVTSCEISTQFSEHVTTNGSFPGFPRTFSSPELTKTGLT